MATTDRHGFLLWSAGFTQSDIILNDLLLKLETKLGLSVLDRDLNEPAGGESAGDCYIVGSSPTGVWSAFSQHDVVILRDSTWYAVTPIAGWPAWVEDESVGVMFNGTSWVIVSKDLPLDKLDATADPTVENDVDEGYSVGSHWYNVTDDKAFVCLDATDGAAVWNQVGGVDVLARVQSNLSASAAPTVDNDTTEGYSVGSSWWDTTNDEVYLCIDATDGAAVWKQVGSGSGGGPLDKFDATADPTVDNDTTEGYSVGSRWINVSSDSVFTCADATDGAAVWISASGLNESQVDALYRPAMMKYDGTAAYYNLTYTSSGNKISVFVVFDLPAVAGANQRVFIVNGPSGRTRLLMALAASDDGTNPNKIIVVTQNSAGTVIWRTVSDNALAGTGLHAVLASFDGDIGAATLAIDGDDAAHTPTTAPTTGTLGTGASSTIHVGSTGSGDFVKDRVGAFGLVNAYRTNYSDFMDGNRPKDIVAATVFGGTPLVYNPHGQLTVNLGSLGALTANGTIRAWLPGFGGAAGLAL